MSKKKKKRSGDFHEECGRIVRDNLNNVELWLERLGREDPEAALKVWANIAEFAHSKKARDGGTPARQEINIMFQPATPPKYLQEKEDKYIDITPKKKGQNE